MRDADKVFEARLRAQLPEAVFRPLAPHYLEEPRGLFHGGGGLVLAPGCVEEVSLIIRACHDASVPVVPYGGGTGLVGGQVMPAGHCARPVILSLERMTRIRAIYPEENVLVAEAGAILADVQAAAEGEGRLFPLSLASEGSCRIGGCLSTNAGGVNVLRYGTARALCLGLEAVLPDGRIWYGLKRLRKDNTGYDLTNLLCGAEGTLGVITAASLRLAPRPRAQATALLVVPGPVQALSLLSLAQDLIGEGISAFELISGTGFAFLTEAGLGGPPPFAQAPAWSVLIDLGLGGGQEAGSALLHLFELAQEKGLVSDGVISQSEAQRAALWKLREEIPLANRHVGAVSSHDISLPLSEIPAFLRRADAAITQLGPFRINAFGHLGDGNLHYNVFPPKGQQKHDHAAQAADIRAAVYDLVQQMGGSFSAEHGVGRLKPEELARYADPTRLATLHAIKQALDPKGIMNPGVMFPLG
ncbi:putative FAD-linked oxidoreductase [Aliiroseovarius sp. xm-m-379]|uniref:FAD-binding oxidoreductase n=1 Tax=unclassified Aliiroseovarius TaxID=2623558 RepID=UPI00156923C3|nr:MULTISPECIES: FAD-binding oxidoreductase [unclassified Aliiroseovarius]NRP12562.1 putative FAD-linked oxidoreductase [Aliiroseovarius sp. xm-d-517]NRP26223.1 putative FAD-linked oxidoreductase [Aliiroseovarius sp. xm-m-379]NRP31790.1 putative FAD-linked oxidoreductase [Aliiroseovarius sp. xm-m-314]NRP35022.1 putative FAD-linked oxidoreductase [Aliiroseovarius sp. xm-a-104]NRP42515.1 putative FAD-linked oxidoreductase [Aliiroseovarius sp. xm-m-339-2]